MPDDPQDPGAAGWTHAAALDRLQPSHPVAVKLAGKHIALFMHRGEVLACNNRCPHEGYPLVEGVLDGDSREWPIDGEPDRTRCVLTCNWHNWKFDLRTGKTLYGGDDLRTYPVALRDGAIWVDLRDAPREQQIEQTLAHLDVAIAEEDSARIARELARLLRAGATADLALARVIEASHTHLRDGMTHAYAAAEAWLRLADTLADTLSDGAMPDDAMRLACASEALSYIAFDTRWERACPYTDKRLPWNEHAFAAAVEAQDEECAIALLAGALEGGMRFDDLEPALAAAALAHYNDFGHSLIYLMHVKRLVARLGPSVERALLCAWTRSLIYATREDLLPDFRGYADALSAWPRDEEAAVSARISVASPDSAHASTHLADALEGQSIPVALDVVLVAALNAGALSPGSRSPSQEESRVMLALHAGLMEAAARHLLRFDEAHAVRTGNSVADNVGWLDFSHALTFGHAVRVQCARTPHLWPAGLLQLAMFVGRNKAYLDADKDFAAARREWAVDDEAAFNARAIRHIVDHGIGLPIFPAHRLKTWSAVRDEIALGVPDATRAALLAAMNRLLEARFKQRHALRMASQALRFVEKEG